MKLIDPETLKSLIYEKFAKLPFTEEEEDPLARGEFEVIKELCSAYPEASEAKEKIDVIIDKCGPQPRGVGIIQTKRKYDVALEDKQAAYKDMIINFIE